MIDILTLEQEKEYLEVCKSLGIRPAIVEQLFKRYVLENKKLPFNAPSKEELQTLEQKFEEKFAASNKNLINSLSVFKDQLKTMLNSADPKVIDNLTPEQKAKYEESRKNAEKKISDLEKQINALQQKKPS